MLQLKNITKTYEVGENQVHALKGVSLRFRKNEFVSILGASGCGKTTLLNIIGGLDKYTSGDLIIDGVSTKQYKDKDWDTYRNHSIGFIFQSYHLIPHQTILQNVELALMISGVSKAERRKRAIIALEKVGLKDKIHNKPNQLSGGQAQRVAIARALINDPEIVLADEPTGALDSVTSVQIMDLLKEISKDRLVIMVTHNPELAEKYSTRIIKLFDGLVVGDTFPFHGVPKSVKKQKKQKGKKKNASMSTTMAMGLSVKNLLSKGKRTAMVSVAGSIGIIGVSMVLAVSAGVNGYIDAMQNDMLSGYPVSVTETAMDYASLMEIAESNLPNPDISKLDDKIYVDSLIKILGSFGTMTTQNTITPAYMDYLSKMDPAYYNVMQFGYGFNISNNIYTDFKVYENSTTDDSSGELSVTAIREMYRQILSEQSEYASWSSMISTVATFAEVPDNWQYIMSQYDILAATDGGKIVSELSDEKIEEIFKSKNSVIMVADNNEIDDLLMGQFGYLTQEEFLNYAYATTDEDSLYDKDLGLVGSGEEDKDGDGFADGLDYQFFLGENAKTFTYYPNDQVYYKLESPIVLDLTMAGMGKKTIEYAYRPYADGKVLMESNAIGYPSSEQMKPFEKDNAVEMQVKIILRKKDSISYGCLPNGFYYTKALTDYVLQTGKSSAIVNTINQNGAPLEWVPYWYKYNAVLEDGSTQVKTMMSSLIDTSNLMGMMMGGGMASGGVDTSVDVSMLGGSNIPITLKIYPTDFDYKDYITEYLDVWNDKCENGESYSYTDEDGKTQTVVLAMADKITYTDTVGLIIAMVKTMIDIITIALISFTALSLVVSTVMIGIITYVSVVERVKEIGILRAVGARKKDIKRLFNSETFIIGLTSGVFGIAVTYLLSFIINSIVTALSGIPAICALPVTQALIMILISVALTLISGLIPASSAAKKDPVVALRTE
ncbi:MAG: ABC transporter ATP-binding protein/permease [Clostridia bacterium]|nr:ABC transporter ATP-binding protein/permease [Clostridia bacterium]